MTIVSRPSLLLEANRHEDMFKAIKAAMLDAAEKNLPMTALKDQGGSSFTAENVRGYISMIDNQIADAKRTLKRQDRIVWYLRDYRLQATRYFGPLQNLHAQYLKEYKAKTGEDWKETNELLSSLEHMLSLPIHEIETIVFDSQTGTQLLTQMVSAEEKWQQERQHIVAPRREDKIVLDLKNGWAWFRLPRASCDAEGDAMGHCGNSLRSFTKDNILSLRKHVSDNEWKPYCTFILHDSGMLGEMKGRFNNKPGSDENAQAKKIIHDGIIALLKLPFIKGITGGGYLANQNFSLYDLDAEDQDELKQAKPELCDAYGYYEIKGYDRVFIDKLANELINNSIPYYDITPEYIVCEEWTTVYQFVHKEGSFSDESPEQQLLKYTTQVFEDDHVLYSDENFIDEIENTVKLRDKVLSRYYSVEEFFENNHAALSKLRHSMLQKIDKLSENYLYEFIVHHPRRVPVYFEKTDDGKVQCCYPLKSILVGLSELPAYEDDGGGAYYSDEIPDLMMVKEYGWTSSYHQSEWDDHYLPDKTADEVLEEIEEAIPVIIAKALDRILRLGPDQLKLDLTNR